MVKDTYRSTRKNMVKHQIKERGIVDARVISAMEKVARHKFVPKEMMRLAYYDCPLPIGEGQTISQPYMVALMSECLEIKGDEKVLEVGTGSGYQTAILSLIAGKVYSVEIRPDLAIRARRTLKSLGYVNAEVVVSDGFKGYRKKAPYDRIIVTAAPEEVPEELLKQLKEGGIIVIPVGGGFLQDLLKIKKVNGKYIKESITSCVFVPLVEE